LQLTLQWLILAAWVVGIDAAATNWTIMARKPIVTRLITVNGAGYYLHEGYDGSRVVVMRMRGKTTVQSTDPPTAMRLCYVWCPAIAGGFISLVALALAATRKGRRLIAEFPVLRRTARRWIIAAAVNLSDRGYSVQPSHLQLTVRWLIHLQLAVRLLIVAVCVLVPDAAAVNWTIEVRKPIDAGGSFSGGVSHRYYRGNDGSRWCVINGPRIGENKLHWIHPPTAMGLCYVWWPSVAGGVLTLVALALAATRKGRRLIAEFPVPRRTAQRWMIAAAVNLSDRGYSVRPTLPQFTARWLILVAWVVGLDAAAIHWTITARKPIKTKAYVVTGGVYPTNYTWYDGSQVTVYEYGFTRKTSVDWTHPPTATGLCYVWWPALAGGFITLEALALAATHNGRRLIAEFPLPRMTTRRLMIAVAVIGIEAALIINVTRKLGGDPRSSIWPPIVFCLAVPPTLVFLPAFGRDRPSGAEKG
jgi:hypothetical protein